MTESPPIYCAPEVNAPGEYRGVTFTESSSHRDAHPLARQSRLRRLTRFGLPDFLRNFVFPSNGEGGQGSTNDHAAQPSHRLATPLQSALKQPGAAPTYPPRSVTYEESVEGMGASVPAHPESDLSLEDMAERDVRVMAYDQMWMLMQRICLREGRFVPRQSKRMSRRRRDLAMESAVNIWEYISQQDYVPTSSEEEHHIRLGMMHVMFLVIKRTVFSDLDRAWNPSLDEDEIIAVADRLSKFLSGFFLPFEREPLGPDHAAFSEELFELAVCVYQLRSLLSPKEGVEFSIYVPMGVMYSERRVEILQNHMRIHETLGADREDEGRDIIYMALCGGLMRKARDVPGPNGRHPRHSKVCERKAVCVGYRPAEGEVVPNKVVEDGRTEEDGLTAARRRALKLEREVGSF